jgi:hypothetical protein
MIIPRFDDPGNPLADIVRLRMIPDGEPWRNLRKGDAYQAGPHLIVGDQWFEIWEVGTGKPGNRSTFFEFLIGNIFIDGELDALLLLPRKRIGRLPKAFKWEDYREVQRPLPLWDKTRWIIRCSKAPYSQSYQSNPRVVFPLYDCRAYSDYLRLYRTCEYVEDDTEETEELQRRFSLKRVAGKYPGLPDITDIPD